jgi:peptidoglycan/LPS O-acetylase OafA/YrhL
VTPTHRRLTHLHALDGVRGLAVIGVLFFHGGFDWAKGGWLGVSVFFTLSGFLITNLLLAEWARERTISLRAFWGRRFRRLLPAAIVCLLLVALYGQLVGTPQQLHNLRGDMLAALGYVANWRFLLADVSYGELFSAPSPLQHFWSLAIEEQFYVLYPLLVLGMLKVGGRRGLGWLLGIAIAGSIAWGLVLSDIDRIYYGTDTRMAELLAGGLLALWWSRPRVDATRAPARSNLTTVVGVLGLVGTIALWPFVAETSKWVTDGVLPLQALLSVMIIVGASETGPVARVLAVRPLVAIGAVSYGLYLFHWPLFLWLDAERVHLTGVPLFLVRIAATTAVTIASYVLVEQPIRRRRVLVRLPVALGAWAGGFVVTIAAALVVTATLPAITLAHADLQASDRTVDVTEGKDVPTVVGAPRSVMMIGDSGFYDLAPGLAAMYRQMGSDIVDVTWPGFGFTRPEFTWRDDWPGLIAEHDPQLVLVISGGWDETFVKDKGAARYDEVVDEAITLLTAGGAKVLWLSVLPGGEGNAAVMDARHRAAARRHPSTVDYADIAGVLRSDDGKYPRWLPGADGAFELVRKPDGWHLCPDGAARVAIEIGAAAQRYGLGPAPSTGWEQGDWRTNARYDDPPGGCNPDRPQNRRETS